MQTGTCTSDVILAREIQKHPSYAAGRHETIDQGKYEKVQVNKSGQKGNIMFRRMLMLRTNVLGCFVIQTSFQYFHFVVHTKNHMVSEAWVRITILYLIQTRTYQMQNTPYTLCLCWMYIYDRQTLYSWFDTTTIKTSPNCHISNLLAIAILLF